jgi:hypothetical protein
MGTKRIRSFVLQRRLRLVGVQWYDLGSYPRVALARAATPTKGELSYWLYKYRIGRIDVSIEQT